MVENKKHFQGYTKPIQLKMKIRSRFFSVSFLFLLTLFTTNIYPNFDFISYLNTYKLKSIDIFEKNSSEGMIAPQINVFPESLFFSTIPGGVVSQTLTIQNLGTGVLEWQIDIGQSNQVVVGSWFVEYDWYCNNNELKHMPVDFFSDGTFSAEGQNGEWLQINDVIQWVFSTRGTKYSGLLSNENTMAGVMETASGKSGCWNGTRLSHSPNLLENVENATWLTYSPQVGELQDGSFVEVIVQANSKGLLPGDHFSWLVLYSNDPQNIAKLVPVQLHVENYIFYYPIMFAQHQG